MADTLRDIVCERHLELTRPGAEPTDVIVRMQRPRRISRREDAWRCRFQITGLDDDRVYEAFGADSFQALLLCSQMIGVRLKSFSRPSGVSLTWLGHRRLGFPVARDMAKSF
jgi:hypothetical protein